MIEPLRLTDLAEAVPRLGYTNHGYNRFGEFRRRVHVASLVLRELKIALPQDILRALRPARTPLLRIEDGCLPADGATRIALYAHYSPFNEISEMVRLQVALLQKVGFAVVFITSSEHISEADWQALRQSCALIVRRRNSGLDFGAWRDLLPEIRARWSVPDEIMLVNDSIVGPIHALDPVIATMRRGGNGLFGLTESLQGGPHLQSYMVLARGQAAVGDLMRFLQKLHISHSKWLLIRLGEIRLSRWMRRRGHRVAAVFGYDRLVQVAVADHDERKRLAASFKDIKNLEELSNLDASALLHRWPVNPTHHLWHVLATRFNGPFIKTELIARNPGRLSDIEEWPTVVPPDSPCPLSILQAHMRTTKMACA